MADTTTSPLSTREIQKLVDALGRSGQPFTKQDAQCALEWAMQIRIEASLLAVVLQGHFALVVKDGTVHLLNNKDHC